jgi:hypothetical protein
VPQGLSGVVAIAAGAAYSLALREDGTIVAWGANDVGQCDVPRGLSGVVAISAGFRHGLAVKADGTVVAWGSNYAGESDVPQGLSGVVAVAAGDPISLALKADGTVVGWGFGGLPQFDVPTGLSGVVDIAAGYSSGLALFGTVSRPPFTVTYQLATSRNTAKVLPLFKLYRAFSHPDWDTFIITGVSSSSAAGGSAQIHGSSVSYTPPPDFVGNDSFTYTVRDGRGASAQGTVQVTVTAPTGNGLNIIGVTVASGGAATIRFAGIPGFPYQVEASTDLVHWTSVGSSNAGANGLFEFVDSQAANYTVRFYRTRSGSALP